MLLFIYGKVGSSEYIRFRVDQEYLSERRYNLKKLASDLGLPVLLISAHGWRNCSIIGSEGKKPPNVSAQSRLEEVSGFYARWFPPAMAQRGRGFRAPRRVYSSAGVPLAALWHEEW